MSHLKLGVVMDPLEHIKPEGDTTIHLLDAAQRYDFSITYLAQKDLHILNGKVFGTGKHIRINRNTPQTWFNEIHTQEKMPLSEFDVILMRKDPPFTLDYIYTTYMLELVEKEGVLVVNKPQSLRDANEKLFATHFPHCCPSTLISSNTKLLMEFWKQEKSVVFKPLDKMAGQSIFVAHEKDPNVHVIIETLSENGATPILVQRYLPEIHTQGDKRILLINGKPAPFAVARFPAQGETRANLAVGGQGIVIPLTERDQWLCAQISATLKEKNLLFVGIDVIGDYITEINVTSPTGLALIAKEKPDTDIAGDFIQALITMIKK